MADHTVRQLLRRVEGRPDQRGVRAAHRRRRLRRSLHVGWYARCGERRGQHGGSPRLFLPLLRQGPADRGRGGSQGRNRLLADQDTQSMAGTFKFELVTPERMVISQDASQVVVPGVEGEFTVLPGHAPVISALRPGVVNATLGDGRKLRAFVKDGFAEVDADRLTILAERAVDVEGIDAARHCRRTEDGRAGTRRRHHGRRQACSLRSGHRVAGPATLGRQRLWLASRASAQTAGRTRASPARRQPA